MEALLFLADIVAMVVLVRWSVRHEEKAAKHA